MRNIVEQLRTGDWINRERTWLCSLALLVASCAGFVFLFATADGLNDYQGRPLGTDFSKVYWTASRAARSIRRPSTPANR